MNQSKRFRLTGEGPPSNEKPLNTSIVFAVCGIPGVTVGTWLVYSSSKLDVSSSDTSRGLNGASTSFRASFYLISKVSDK